MVAHQNRKYGLPAESITPVTTGALFAALVCCSSGERMSLSIWIAIKSKNIPPAKPIMICAVGNFSILPGPNTIKTISGNSTMPCPTAISAPAYRERAPIAMAAAVTGPGAITPESDITITSAKKSSRLTKSPSRNSSNAQNRFSLSVIAPTNNGLLY